MPRPALKNVSTAALQAEIERRVSKLADLLRLRDDVDAQIADLKTLAGQFVQPAAAPAAPAAKPVRRRGKAKVAKVVAKPVSVVAKPMTLTASELVLSLLSGGKVLTTSQIMQAARGREGAVGNALHVLTKAGKIKRQKVKGGAGSEYRLAGVAPKAAAEPEAKPTAVKPVAKQPGKFAQTGNEFILGLLAGGKVLTSQQLQAAWTEAGRKGKVAKTLGALVADKRLARRKLQGRKGFDYTLADFAAAKAVAAKPAAKKPVATKPLAKKGGKRTFACPTCKQVFASGPMLGVHYKAEPSHRVK